MSAHTCHALGCDTPCPPARLMCPKHWRKVPTREQTEVYRSYEGWTAERIETDPGYAGYLSWAERLERTL